MPIISDSQAWDHTLIYHVESTPLLPSSLPFHVSSAESVCGGMVSTRLVNLNMTVHRVLLRSVPRTHCEVYGTKTRRMALGSQPFKPLPPYIVL